MALKKSGVICELREVLLNNKPNEMILLSPKGTVPVIELCDGKVLDESLDIMRWALSIRDPDNWLIDIDGSKKLIAEFDRNFKKILDKYKYYVRFPEFPQIHYRNQGEKFLIMLEERLIKNKGKGLCNNQTTFSDIAIFPFIRQFAFVDKAWFEESSYTFLKNWLSKHLESELFLSTMKKTPPWKPKNKIVFL